MKNQFKVEDMVYYPENSRKICKIEKNPSSDDRDLIIVFPDERFFSTEETLSQAIYSNGDRYPNSIIPCILHATQENYELLSKLYPNVEFEKPPVRKEPKEIIQAMLDGGWHYVPCRVSDTSEHNALSKDLIYGVISDSQYNFEGEWRDWVYAIPFDPKTGKIIVDYDGEIVTE